MVEGEARIILLFRKTFYCQDNRVGPVCECGLEYFGSGSLFVPVPAKLCKWDSRVCRADTSAAGVEPFHQGPPGKSRGRSLMSPAAWGRGAPCRCCAHSRGGGVVSSIFSLLCTFAAFFSLNIVANNNNHCKAWFEKKLSVRNQCN